GLGAFGSGGVGAGPGSGLLVHCVVTFDQLFGGALGERVTDEVAELVALDAAQHGPGAFYEPAGNRDKGLGVGVSTVDHQPVVELRQLWVVASGDVGGLVEGQPQHGRSFLGDSTVGLHHCSGGPVRRGDTDVAGGVLGRVVQAAVAEVGADGWAGDRPDAGDGVQQWLVAVEAFPVLAGLFGDPGDTLLGGGQVGEVLGDVER